MLLSMILSSWLTIHAALLPAAERRTEKLSYQVRIGDKQAGTFQVEKISLLGENEYIYNMETNVSFLFWDVQANIQSKYKDQQLLESFAKEKVNGKMKDQIQTIRTEESYQISKNEKKTMLNEPIYHSVSTLYHQEPSRVSRVFAERQTKFCSLRALSLHRYELTLPNGNKNYYYYEQGVCAEMKASMLSYSIRFVLVR